MSYPACAAASPPCAAVSHNGTADHPHPQRWRGTWMSIVAKLSKWFRPIPRSTLARKTRRPLTYRPTIEVLEGRTLPAVITPFAVRFSANDTGDIVFAANTVVTARPSVNPPDSITRTATQVANAQGGTGLLLNNNDFIMAHVDVDADATTFNSSRANLNLPPGANVLFAGLYWGGDSNSALRNQVRLATPASGGYVNITGVVVGS